MNLALKVAVHFGLELILAGVLASIGIPLHHEVASVIILTATSLFHYWHPKYARWKRLRLRKKLYNID